MFWVADVGVLIHFALAALAAGSGATEGRGRQGGSFALESVAGFTWTGIRTRANFVTQSKTIEFVVGWRQPTLSPNTVSCQLTHATMWEEAEASRMRSQLSLPPLFDIIFYQRSRQLQRLIPSIELRGNPKTQLRKTLATQKQHPAT